MDIERRKRFLTLNACNCVCLSLILVSFGPILRIDFDCTKLLFQTIKQKPKKHFGINYAYFFVWEFSSILDTCQ